MRLPVVDGGIAPNVIADKAYFYWDLRTIPMDDVNTVVNEFHAYCQEREAILKQTFPGFSIETKENHPIVPHLDTQADAEVVDLIKRICGNTTLNTVSYASEAGQFANEGFQSIICGPGSIEQAHRANEFIAKNELEKGVVMIKKLILELSL